MKYYYEKPSDWISAGVIFKCDHPLFNRCTLFQNGSKGICVVQERYNEKTKVRWLDCIDPWLAGDIYMNENFSDFLNKHATEKDTNGLYPVVSVRKLMWALRMKPLKKEYWEENI